jgi:hypothetical protein
MSAAVTYRGVGGTTTAGGIGFGFNPAITSAKVILCAGSLEIIPEMTVLAK